MFWTSGYKMYSTKSAIPLLQEFNKLQCFGLLSGTKSPL